MLLDVLVSVGVVSSPKALS